jgi:hypothetical protein
MPSAVAKPGKRSFSVVSRHKHDSDVIFSAQLYLPIHHWKSALPRDLLNNIQHLWRMRQDKRATGPMIALRASNRIDHSKCAQCGQQKK